MWWRLARSRFIEQKGEANRKAFKKIVDTGPPPGLIAYSGPRPIGWCALAPRGTFPVLERSRILKPVDAQPVWSVVCLFVAKPFRRSGISAKLLKAAAAYARKCGAKIVEGYPVDPGSRPLPDVFAWTGLAPAFRKAGFEEVLRRSKTRPIMRRPVG